MKKLVFGFVSFLLLAGLGWAARPREISPAYDVYIGFLATGQCPPPQWGNPYFKSFSFNSVIRDVRFEFGQAVVRKKTYNWWFATLDVESTPAMLPLIGSFGDGDIDQYTLCPYWNVDNHGKPLKCTLVHIKNKFMPGMRPVDIEHIAREKNVLDPRAVQPGQDEVPLTPLVSVPDCVFEYHTNFFKQTEVSLEDSDGKPELSEIRFASILPEVELLAGREVTYEFPYKIPEVIGSGVMTIRYVPVKSLPAKKK